MYFQPISSQHYISHWISVICCVDSMTGFQVKCNNGLKWIKANLAQREKCPNTEISLVKIQKTTDERILLIWTLFTLCGSRYELSYIWPISGFCYRLFNVFSTKSITQFTTSFYRTIRRGKRFRSWSFLHATPTFPKIYWFSEKW